MPSSTTPSRATTRTPKTSRCCTPWRRRCARARRDVGLGFDGDGDRCGVVDNEGQEIFADKIGVMLARDLSTLHPGSTFVVDVKSTGLFTTDPALIKNGVKADYWKTGHSYIKRRVNELAPSPASRSPAISSSTSRSAAATTTASSPRSPSSTCSTATPGSRWPISTTRCRRPGARRPCRRIAPTKRNMASPTRCATRFIAMQEKGEKIAGHDIADLVTVNGVRVVAEDGTWGLVRASSNKPELVVVVESPVRKPACANVQGGRRGDAREPDGRRLQPDDLSVRGQGSGVRNQKRRL